MTDLPTDDQTTDGQANNDQATDGQTTNDQPTLDQPIVDLKRVANIIAMHRPDEQFMSAQIIQEYLGEYVANTGTPVGRSWNGQFGKILSINREVLGIEKLSKKAEPIIDDHGHRTTSTRWVCLELVR